ncbi:bifunctional UDP-N-acetylglucosamine diphosphorylase/glucosamine-1-phosphate N-acetyltransferase GlmU [Candidatus Ichthyocystis hellenicum]|uniref:bifunctional UDP-N-acetylglucosamine diphosphorylase/glucosamine-1-phosphate N-acetyltransferase GlmU n=1 Tax=Candidatus Ichthyocystis hellenicum TaxID=1561003 RepID=UPI000A4D366A|nr:bifunctional UDP-N-acetylglucosamine diphosphorylase/glucosamine-1-phosphate N-acetyltransferase GlmU [Candidatus Ichthyocystis hellenicum]
MNIIILAAGRSTRMRSQKPKILHHLAGRPVLSHVIQTAKELKSQQVVIVCGKDKGTLQSLVDEDSIFFAEQPEPTGTGSAARIGLDFIRNDDLTLVLCADMPLISAVTLQNVVTSHKQQGADLTLVTEKFSNPSCYGRIIRNRDNKIIEIVEEKDATEEERKISEVNCGIYCSRATVLLSWLDSLEAHNSQGEYYLTDIVKKAALENRVIASVQPNHHSEIHGINDAKQLEQAERILQKNQAEHLMSKGTRLADASRIEIRGDLVCEEDVFIDINCIFTGKVHLGKNVNIGPNCYISNSKIQDNSEILPNSVIEGSIIGSNASIGPFARIRPSSDLRSNTKVGNFVEIKNSVINQGSKINHLAYIGDAKLGRNVMIGAGTITCNFDGTRKNPSSIGDHSFIGSGTQLIAPIQVGDYVTIGAGSTITKNIPDNCLAVSRIQQKNIPKKKQTEEDNTLDDKEEVK